MSSSPTTSPSSSTAVNTSPRTVEITIHRCTGVLAEQMLGFKRRRDYFVEVTIGTKKERTRDRTGGDGSLAWNEKLTFYNVEKPYVTISLYCRHTLRKPELLEQFTYPLPETRADDTSSPTISRTTTFINGPQIDFSVATLDSVPSEIIEQLINNQQEAKDNKIHDEARLQELRAQDPGGPNKPQEEITQKDHGEMNTDAIEEAKRALESQPTPKDVWKRVLEGIKAFEETAGVIAEVHPFAKLAYIIFHSISGPLIDQLGLDEDIRSLFDSFANFCNIINSSRNPEIGKNEKLREVLKRTSLQMTDVAYFVRDYCKVKGFVRRALKNKISGVGNTIEEYRTRLEEMKEEFCIQLAIETGTTVIRIENIAARTENIVAQTEIKVVRVLKVVGDTAQVAILDDIAYVPGAGLDMDKMCLDGTRMNILEEIMEWISLDGSRAMWLCGGAGTGKSAIAHTIAARFKELGRLGSMFCFSDAERAARKPASLFPHIARDLADLEAGIRHELCKAAQNKADRTTSSITTQFEKLVLAPANAIREHLHGPIVIIIEALDESGTVEERRGLLQVLASKLGELPPNFRVIITSRPDLDIHTALLGSADLAVKKMHSISSQSTAEDITTYVKKQLEGDPDVSKEICQGLASHARGLFQWAKVACEFVRNHGPGETAQDRYEELILPLPSRAMGEIGGDVLLDHLYHSVLSRVLSPTRKAAMENFRFVMSRILTAFEPLSCKSLNRLFKATKAAPKNCKAENIVAYFGSLLSGVDDQDTPIRPLHTSFRDFLTNPERSGDFFVPSSTPEIHSDMASAWLLIMKEELRFNICQLPTSHAANKDIPGVEAMIQKHISSHLSYACRFWGAHLCAFATSVPPVLADVHLPVNTDGWNQLIKDVHGMLHKQVLYWLEVLSLLRASENGLQQFRQVYTLVRARGVDEEVVFLIKDVEMFWSYFAKCIAASAAHIYVSALPFAPKNSLVARTHRKSNSKTLSIVAGQLQDYPSCLNVIYGHTDYIMSVACSPDGRRIISCSKDKTIRVWNAESGEMIVGPLIGHTAAVNSIALSPDGERIVSGSNDQTLLVWNAETGEIILGPLKGHTDWVVSVAYSPDGTLIASSSVDQTIRIWNAENGDMVLGPLEGHSDWIGSIVFSPDSTRIASGSDDLTINVWNTQNGEVALGPLRCHTSQINSVTFSPDGTRIASGSDDKTIRIWSAESGEMVLEPLEDHSGVVISVAFSPNGTRLVSAGDGTIRVWNTENGEMVLGPLEGHSSFIQSVTFSTDGTRLVSGCNDLTIRVWNVEREKISLEPLEGHASWVMSAPVSPDGTRIVSASYDNTIRVWNMESGEMVLGPLRGHTDFIHSVTISPDGMRFATGSTDKTIRIWSLESGEMVLGPLEGHTDGVWSVAFSPDGSRLASGSEDKTIRIWSSENGEMVLGPLEGHTSLVRSVVFSPDGARIVSGSNDKTTRVWNAKNGEMVFQPLNGRVAAISRDGSSIVSASDSNIWVWNAETGEMLQGPLSGHTSRIDSVALSPDGDRFVSGCADGTIWLWELKTGKVILGLEGHTDFVMSVTFSPDSRRIVSCSSDNSIRVWNVDGVKIGTDERDELKSIPGASSTKSLTESGLPQNGWRTKDGWSLGDKGELLFYVPPVHQLALWGPRTGRIISRHQPTKLDMSQFAHGSRWTQCFESYKIDV